MFCLTFNFNKNLIYAIIYWVLEIITRIIMYLDWNFFQIVKKDSINEYLFVILLNISDLLSGFLVLYINSSLKKKTFKEKNDNTSSSSKRIKIIEGGGQIAPKTKNFIYKIILICCLDYLNRSTFFIFYEIFKEATHDNISDKVQKDIIIHLDIIARYFFSIVILKLKIFKHHKLAIIIILIGFAILFPTDLISIEYFNFDKIDKFVTYKYIGIFSIRGILFPFEDTIIKTIFINDYIIPEKLMFIRGIGEFILILIVTPFLYFFIWQNDVSNIIFNESLASIILIIIFYILTSFVKAYLLLKVIYYFSSQSVSFLILSESITGSIANIIKFFIEDENDNKYYIIILLIEVIVIFNSTFGTLIYDEIIVIKKWGMNVNVAKEISKRGILELSTIKMIDDNNNEEEEHDDEEK